MKLFEKKFKNIASNRIIVTKENKKTTLKFQYKKG